jgi:predicted  nucleic acid-binding Zn-ribbon protein
MTTNETAELDGVTEAMRAIVEHYDDDRRRLQATCAELRQELQASRAECAALKQELDAMTERAMQVTS